MAPTELKLAQAAFIHNPLLIAIFSAGGGGGDIEKKIQKKASLLMYNTVKQRFEHGVYHNLIQDLQLDFTFSLPSFIMVAGILETSVAVDTSPT